MNACAFCNWIQKLGRGPAPRLEMRCSISCLPFQSWLTLNRPVCRRTLPDCCVGGSPTVSTPNRTTNSKLLLVGLAKATGQIPRGTHGWTRSTTSEELKAMVGPEVVDTT